MRISDFTEYELEEFRRSCNFVGKEREVFELRSVGFPLEDIAEMLDYSHDGIRKVSCRINNKISKVQAHLTHI